MILRYLLVGGTAAAVDWSVFAVLALLLGAAWFPASLCSFLIATALNYVLSVRFVFRSGTRFARRHEIGLVFLVSALGLAINQGCMWIAIEGFGCPLLPAKMLATGVVFGWNYGLRRFVIFAEPPAALRTPR